MASKRRVEGYRDTEQEMEILDLETHQYRLPFNYKNITVFRKVYHGGEFHGMELFPANPPSPRITVKQCPTNEWFRVATVFEVPPTAVRVRFEVEIAQQRPGETLLIDDVSSAVVPAAFRETDSLPKGAKNHLKNPGFEDADSGGGVAKHWEILTAGEGKIELTDARAHKGKRSVMIEGVSGIAMWQDMDVSEGQTLRWSAWLRSSEPAPRVVWIFPKFFDVRGGEVSDVAGDCIVVREDKPIVRVVVIGSACTPPGYVQVECEEIESWRRADELRDVMPVRFRINNLWGMHLRADQWGSRTKNIMRSQNDKPYEQMPQGLIDVYPGLADCAVKSDYYEFPFTGMSSATFEVPPSKRVIIRGGSEIPGWSSDQAPDDAHYSFRIIRTTVMK